MAVLVVATLVFTGTRLGRAAALFPAGDAPVARPRTAPPPEPA